MAKGEKGDKRDAVKAKNTHRMKDESLELCVAALRAAQSCAKDPSVVAQAVDDALSSVQQQGTHPQLLQSVKRLVLQRAGVSGGLDEYDFDEEYFLPETHQSNNKETEKETAVREAGNETVQTHAGDDKTTELSQEQKAEAAKMKQGEDETARQKAEVDKNKQAKKRAEPKSPGQKKKAEKALDDAREILTEAFQLMKTEYPDGHAAIENLHKAIPRRLNLRVKKDVTLKQWLDATLPKVQVADFDRNAFTDVVHEIILTNALHEVNLAFGFYVNGRINVKNLPPQLQGYSKSIALGGNKTNLMPYIMDNAQEIFGTSDFKDWIGQLRQMAVEKQKSNQTAAVEAASKKREEDEAVRQKAEEEEAAREKVTDLEGREFTSLSALLSEGEWEPFIPGVYHLPASDAGFLGEAVDSQKRVEELGNHTVFGQWKIDMMKEDKEYALQAAYTWLCFIHTAEVVHNFPGGDQVQLYHKYMSLFDPSNLERFRADDTKRYAQLGPIRRETRQFLHQMHSWTEEEDWRNEHVEAGTDILNAMQQILQNPDCYAARVLAYVAVDVILKKTRAKIKRPVYGAPTHTVVQPTGGQGVEDSNVIGPDELDAVLNLVEELTNHSPLE